MPAPRLLVMEGNTAEGRALLSAAGGAAPSVGYAKLLRELWPGVIADICHPADAGANLPDRMGLEGYDGAVITGSALNVYKGGPAIERQIELVRTVLAAGTPLFGSCWGLQVDHGGDRRERAEESEGPRDRIRPAHPAHRRRPRARDVCGQGRGVRRRHRAYGRGGDAVAGHAGAGGQRRVGGAGRRSPLQRRRRLGRAIPSGIYARGHGGDRAPLRQAAGRGRVLLQRD